ncbi:hypothetical protein BDM02DRAFT_3121964 [Thelephora ganbajun]|uniref:Uncharacterized protein n=1 Tax=Thelephora ganbajun TaxID=370292 RepID=A0ACB6Z4D7_THEGA|nr:hypothetical protein BDM02DRAFT_3121964 [Thelephora ganbajun]
MSCPPFWGALCLEASAVRQRPRDISGLLTAGNNRDVIELRVLLSSTAMTDVDDDSGSQFSSFFGTILEPGSSFNPTFLLVVDGAFTSLFVVLVTLAVLTKGNVHLIFLTFIELALWVSVKWYVNISSRFPMVER